MQLNAINLETAISKVEKSNLTINELIAFIKVRTA